MWRGRQNKSPSASHQGDLSGTEQCHAYHLVCCFHTPPTKKGAVLLIFSYHLMCDTSFTPRRVAKGHHTHPFRCNTILAITRIYVSLIWFQPDYHPPLYYTVDCVFCSVFLFPYTFATWFCSSAVLLFPSFPTFGRLQQWKTIVNSTPHKCRWNSNIRRKPLSKPCYPALSSQKSRKWKYLTTSRLEICQKIYTTGFSSQKFYTLKETAYMH